MCITKPGQTTKERRQESDDFSSASSSNDLLRYEDVLHVIAIPNYKEDVATLRRTRATLAQQRDASTQLVVVLAMEARDPLARATAQTLRKEFSHQFRGMHCTLHSLKSGEVAGKSSNENWAVDVLKEDTATSSVLDPTELSRICDAGHSTSPSHFSALSAAYCSVTSNNADEPLAGLHAVLPELRQSASLFARARPLSVGF